ncbi:AI-2E family transporter [Amaricoccus solimangrovi]|uniref:AI-2E family transporter n=1 Tax=Amaricoccus solimangrovi TaxID=2589815 RepID=A0A501X0E5_9RHOB|nr:AI-2E family transporter [Amaricoccus solimangrovi]TPE53837.1 AI-2E family transporter [Amaricoccus solimangrovi]
MRDTTEQKGFTLLLILVTVAFCWLLLPFYGAIMWAAILAIIFSPMQNWLLLRLGPRRNLAAVLSVLICIVIAIIPMTLIAMALVDQGKQVFERAQSHNFDVSRILDDVRAALPPMARQWLDQVGGEEIAQLRQKLTDGLMQGSQLVAGKAFTIGQDTLSFLISSGIMLYLLFFFFRDGRFIARNIRASMPLSEEYSRQLIGKTAAVVRATVKGNVIIALIQGTIGGVAFWFIGIEGALLWGAVMSFLSLLPAIGAALVWAPVAAYLMLVQGDYFSGLLLVGVGVGVIGLVDNLLRPPLVGKDTRLPDYVVLTSTVGGMSILGINGFVIGPLVAALFMAAWGLFREERER